MALRSGSVSRSLMSTARASIRSSAPSPLSRLVPPPLAAAPRRRFSIPVSRNFGPIGCAQSLLPLHSTVAVSSMMPYLSVSARACCALPHGT